MSRIDLNSKKLLNNGSSVPVFGFGVYHSSEGREVENVVVWALGKEEMGRFLGFVVWIVGCIWLF